MAYEITHERLAALSPVARQLAEIALEEGIWVLVDENVERHGGAPRDGGAQHGGTSTRKSVAANPRR